MQLFCTHWSQYHTRKKIILCQVSLYQKKHLLVVDPDWKVIISAIWTRYEVVQSLWNPATAACIIVSTNNYELLKMHTRVSRPYAIPCHISQPVKILPSLWSKWSINSGRSISVASSLFVSKVIMLHSLLSRYRESCQWTGGLRKDKKLKLVLSWISCHKSDHSDESTWNL